MAFLNHPTVKIYCKAGPNFSVTIRDGQVVLAPANPTDEYQHWYKDYKAFPYFTLVNKKTGEAIKHAVGAHQTVQLVPYDSNVVDESILWTEGMDLGTGYKSIQMGKNTGLFFNACGGYAKDGVSIIAYPWADGKDNEVWKIEEYSTIRVYCKDSTYTDFIITIRDGNVVLAKSNLSDEFQHWHKVEKYGDKKDEEGHPSFALINKATGQALKHAVEAHKPLQLVPYNPTDDVEAILWTEGKNLGDGYKAIRMANNISLTMNACGGCAEDGVSVILYPWSNGTNEQWRIELFTPYVIPKETVKLNCKAKIELSITIRDGLVVLAPSNPTDEFQHWYKYNTIDNDEVFPSFALVNKKTSQAIKHSAGAREPVQLIPFNPNVLDECILWTEGTDLSSDYISIQMGNKTGMFFSASGGYASDGVRIVANPSEDGKDSVAWKIEQYTSVKVGCKVGTTDFNITIRDGSVVLAKSNLSDEFQHWYKEEKYSIIKDDQGYPSFALINKATGQALKQSVGANQPLQLVAYNATVVDESILWTECKNLGDGYNAILATNTNLILNACGGNADDGVSIILSSRSSGEKLMQWLIEPFTPYVLSKETVKLRCKVGPTFSLTIKDGKVVITRSNPGDKFQHWYKYNTMNDKSSPTSFALVNQKTGQAIKHSVGARGYVQLIHFNPNVLDESILWTESADMGSGYKSIQMGYNTGMFFNKQGGYTYDGARIIVFQWSGGQSNELWMIEQYTTNRIYCKAGTDFNITIRDGNVVLAKSNLSDDFQHWYKFENHSDQKDDEGYPSFALINKATGQALKHAVAAHEYVQLAPYNPANVEKSILWTEGKDLGDGFKAIRMATNSSLNVNACYGYAADGVKIILYPWSDGKNNEQWKIEPF